MLFRVLSPLSDPPARAAAAAAARTATTWRGRCEAGTGAQDWGQLGPRLLGGSRPAAVRPPPPTLKRGHATAPPEAGPRRGGTRTRPIARLPAAAPLLARAGARGKAAEEQRRMNAGGEDQPGRAAEGAGPGRPPPPLPREPPGPQPRRTALMNGTRRRRRQRLLLLLGGRRAVRKPRPSPVTRAPPPPAHPRAGRGAVSPVSRVAAALHLVPGGAIGVPWPGRVPGNFSRLQPGERYFKKKFLLVPMATQ